MAWMVTSTCGDVKCWSAKCGKFKCWNAKYWNTKGRGVRCRGAKGWVAEMSNLIIITSFALPNLAFHPSRRAERQTSNNVTRNDEKSDRREMKQKQKQKSQSPRRELSYRVFSAGIKWNGMRWDLVPLPRRRWRGRAGRSGIERSGARLGLEGMI